jgi:biofilm protein TabA
MILDSLVNYKKYECLNPVFKKAFDYLKQTDFSKITPGEYEIDGRDVYAVVVHADASNDKNSKLEIHKKYIDIQYTFKGSFKIGWRSLKDCRLINTEYDESKDFQLFSDQNDSEVVLSEGIFAIFFPGDAHAPINPDLNTIKVIIKVLN